MPDITILHHEITKPMKNVLFNFCSEIKQAVKLSSWGLGVHKTVSSILESGGMCIVVVMKEEMVEKIDFFSRKRDTIQQWI